MLREDGAILSMPNGSSLAATLTTASRPSVSKAAVPVAVTPRKEKNKLISFAKYIYVVSSSTIPEEILKKQAAVGSKNNTVKQFNNN